ncbi:MAG TPA: hotdog fold thioesterase [Flavitalea sp.]|nr:hotdog fold thioesterase [Flavitalea sp.]
MIWFNHALTLDILNNFGHGNMGEYLGIKFIDITEDSITATMPVDHRTKQPYGLLHGGASCVLAETLGSVASALVVDAEKYIVVGIEINANHLRGARQGLVTGIVKPIHIGGTTHVWDIRISDENEKPVCISRLTVAVLENKSKSG